MGSVLASLGIDQRYFYINLVLKDLRIGYVW